MVVRCRWFLVLRIECLDYQPSTLIGDVNANGRLSNESGASLKPLGHRV